MAAIKLIGDTQKLQKGLDYLSEEMELSLSSDGIPVHIYHSSEQDHLTIRYDGAKGEIVYTTKNNFFRQLNLWVLNYKKGKPFEKKETVYFEKTGAMFDVSRNAVLNEAGIKKLLRHMARFGLNLAMLYTEDTYEVEDYPYFGYLRGRYSKEELKSFDDYAYDLGIEMIPCIQTLGHLYQVLQFGTHPEIQDTHEVLLVGEPKTYEFIEHMIAAAAEPFRSNRIHIGMDEAWGVGAGRYKKINEYKNTFEIMNEHIAKVTEITDRLGLEPMMWSDMYFRTGSETGDYYDLKSHVPEEIIEGIPNVDMVFWDYYHEDEESYLELMQRHLDMKKKVVFAGGIWTWNGMAPNFGKTFVTTKAGLSAAKELGIKDVFATMWGDDGGETSLLTALPGLQYFADLSYRESFDEELADDVSVSHTGLTFEEFGLLRYLDETPGVEENNLEVSHTSKVLLWQDPMLGRYDKGIEKFDLSAHYAELAEKLEPLTAKANYPEIFVFYHQFAKVLSKRADFGIRLQAAYDEKDKEALKERAETAKELTEELGQLRLAHRKLWMTYNKPFGWEILDIRYGGAMTRLRTTADRLQEYLNGEVDRLEELEEKKLTDPSQGTNGLGFGLYKNIVSTSRLSGV